LEKKGWKISPFSLNLKESEADLNPLAIKAGNYLRLFHREIEGFIEERYDDLNYRFNEDSQSSPIDSLFAIFEEMKNDKSSLHHIYFKKSSILKKSKSSHSSHSIFQIQHERPDQGGLITWNKPVRFVHGI
jgi:hypothetical protein